MTAVFTQRPVTSSEPVDGENNIDNDRWCTNVLTEFSSYGLQNMGVSNSTNRTVQNRNGYFNPGARTNDNNMPRQSDNSTTQTPQQQLSTGHFSRGGDAQLPDGDFRDISGHGCHVPRSRMDRVARNQLIAVSVLCFLFMSAEIVGGVLSNSLALLTDAAHLASDLASFLVSLFALWLATKPPTKRMNFGYHRAEVLGALFSIMVIWVMTGVLVYFAVRRIQPIIHPDLPQYSIHPDEMLITAGIGVAFNIVMALVLHSGIFKKCSLPTSLGHNHSHSNSSHSHGSINHDLGESLDEPLIDNTDPGDNIAMATRRRNDTYHSNINIKAAVIHVVGDIIQSVGVLVAAIVIKINPEKYKIADPICTFLFSALVLFTTFTVLKDVVLLVMEASPSSIDRYPLKQGLLNLPGVKSVHCLNIWALTVEKVAVTVHLAVDNSVSRQDILFAAGHFLRTEHHVMHSTIQIEDYSEEMATCTQCQV